MGMSVVCASEQSGLSEGLLLGRFVGRSSCCNECKGKAQLPKGEPQAHAPRARRVPNTDSSEAWLPMKVAATHVRLRTSGTLYEWYCEPKVKIQVYYGVGNKHHPLSR